MRKRFVRLAIIAVVVLVAFLMYRSTEGFRSPGTGPQYTCANFIKSGNTTKSAIPGTIIGKNKNIYVCESVNLNDRTGNFKCSTDFPTSSGKWDTCPSLYTPTSRTKSKCYTCTK
jgi:hypothetical protein